jgi:hypothetical protein
LQVFFKACSGFSGKQLRNDQQHLILAVVDHYKMMEMSTIREAYTTADDRKKQASVIKSWLNAVFPFRNPGQKPLLD